MSVVEAIIILIALRFRWLVTFSKRRYDECAGQIGTEDGKEGEFALGIHVRAPGKIVAQVAFG
jgi:hypothetical protein